MKEAWLTRRSIVIGDIASRLQKKERFYEIGALYPQRTETLSQIWSGCGKKLAS